MRRPYVVAYDISDDSHRTRVADSLETIAVNHQRSVWVTSRDLQMSPAELAHGLAGLVGRNDRIRVLSPCSSCCDRIKWDVAGIPNSWAPARRATVGIEDEGAPAHDPDHRGTVRVNRASDIQHG